MRTVIKYKKRRLYGNLFIGLAWLVFFIIGLVVDFKHIDWHYYFYIIIPLAYLGQYFYESHYQYLIINYDIITKPELFNHKSINLSDITEIYTYKGDYVICNVETKIKLSKNMIDPESYRILSKFIDDYSEINQIELKERLV